MPAREPKAIFHTTDHADRELGIESGPQGDVEVYIASANDPQVRFVELDREQIASLHEALGELLANRESGS